MIIIKLSQNSSGKTWFCFYIFLVAAPERPVPKRAPPKQPKTYPQAEALYDYTASDTDEISLNAGEKLSVLKEGKFNISPNITTIRALIFQQDLLQNNYYFRFHFRWIWLVDGKAFRWKGRIFPRSLCAEALKYDFKTPYWFFHLIEMKLFLFCEIKEC